MAADEAANRVRIEEHKGQQVQVRWANPEHLDPVYADQMHLTRLNDQYYLTFGQLRPTFTDVAKGIPVAAEIRPIIRLIMSKEALKNVLELLGKSLEKMSEGR